MEKKAVLKEVIRIMREELALLSRAADDARSGATDSEVRSESKYDTRGLESSYLARGHAMQFESLAADVAVLEGLECPDFTAKDPIGIGALVAVDMGGETMLFFLLPNGGGTEVALEEGPGEVTVITPEAPLGKQLMGLKVGDSFRLNAQRSPSTIRSVE